MLKTQDIAEKLEEMAELMEFRGEIEAAADHTWPSMITRDDVRGFFHFHTPFSDGADSLENMARAALKRGIAFIGVADHSRSLSYADPDRLNLDRRWIQTAYDLRIRFTINPDTHPTKGIDDLEFSIGIARKGGLTPADVINCHSIPPLIQLFKHQ